MVDSISRGFINKNRIAEEQVIDNNVNKLSRTEEQVKKGIIDFNKRLSKSIYVFSKAIHTLENTRETRELKSKLDKAIKTSSIQDKIRKGKSVSSTEAKELIQAAEDMNDVMLNNEKLRIKIKELGYKSENLDITKPLITASQKIAESAKEVFINNAERITQSEVGSDLAKTGVRAVSPELAFISESLGVGLPNFFESEDQEEDIVVTELSKLNDSVGNLEDAVGGVSDATKEGILDEIEYLKELIDNLKSYPKQTQEIVDEIKQLEEEIKIYQNTLQDIESDKANEQKKTAKKQIKSDQKIAEQAIQADNKRNEENLLVQADQHRDQMEILDDIKDLQNKSIFEKLLDFLDIRKSPFLKKVGVASAIAGTGIGVGSRLKEGVKTLGTTALSAGKVGVKAGAVAGGGLLGFDALRNIREEGLTSGNILQSAGSGALIGAAFGPLGALIGGGVGTIAAFITNAISPQDMLKIEKGFTSISKFFSEGIGKGINWIINSTKKTYEWITTFSFSEWFKNIGNSLEETTKTARDWINEKASKALDFYISAENKFKEGIEYLSNGISNIGEWIRTKFNEFKSSELLDSITSAVFGPFQAIADFVKNPKDILSNVFAADVTEMDQSLKTILDFILYPVEKIKQAIMDTADFLGFGNPEEQNNTDLNTKTKEEQIREARIKFFKGELTADQFNEYKHKINQGIPVSLPNSNTSPITSSVPQTNTSKIIAPNNSETSLEIKADQNKTIQEIQQLKEKQEQKAKEDKKSSKTESKPDKVSGYSSRNHSNVSLNGNIGLAILTANIA